MGAVGVEEEGADEVGLDEEVRCVDGNEEDGIDEGVELEGNEVGLRLVGAALGCEVGIAVG